jgi:hypothetical protein
LCALSDVSLWRRHWSQHGEGHINEQWSFSADPAKHDLLPQARHPAYEQFARRFAPASPAMIDVVHPDLFIDRMNVKRGVRRLAKNIHRMALQIAGRFPPKVQGRGRRPPGHASPQVRRKDIGRDHAAAYRISPARDLQSLPTATWIGRQQIAKYRKAGRPRR